MKLNKLSSFDTWKNRALREIDRMRRIISQCSEILRKEFNPEIDSEVQSRDPFCSQRSRFPTPQTVIDIGGSHGQFAREVIKSFPSADVYTFEPIPECFAELQALAAKYTQIYPRKIALSDSPGFQEFNVSAFNDSSSFQPMRPEHTEAWPHTNYEHTILVEKARLDDLIDLNSIQSPIFVKIDVQGHEMFVIRGGNKVIAQSHRVMIECNYVHLYDGQPTFGEIYLVMKEMGFLFDGMISPLHHPTTGELMSGDLVFYKK
jgi:FkbM family methyltransferase